MLLEFSSIAVRIDSVHGDRREGRRIDTDTDSDPAPNQGATEEEGPSRVDG